jgi:signal transduction histidine kinase
VRGTISAHAIQVLDYAHTSIQDENHYGLLIKSSPDSLSHLEPGQVVIARGTIERHAGMPVLAPQEIRVLAKAPAPQPIRVRLASVTSFRYLGVLIETDGDVLASAANTGGAYVNLGDAKDPLKVFLPHKPGRTLAEYSKGDRIRVSGIAMQYCPQPPYNRQYQLLVAGPSALRIVERRWIAPPGLLLAAFLTLLAALGVWWIRERRMSAQRKAMLELNALSEDILNAESAVDIASRFAAAMPPILGLSAAHLYLYNKGTRSLDRVRTRPDAEMVSIPLDNPTGYVAGAAALCFRNRTILHIPDTRKSPFYSAAEDPKPPRSLLLVPAFSQNEIMAILHLENSPNLRRFNRDEQAAAQHFGNLIGTSLRLQEQFSVREHLFRGERVAAAGQLVSGVASELSAPLKTITALAARLQANRDTRDSEGDLNALGVEAARASEIVSRLVSLARSEKSIAETIDLRELLKELIAKREREHVLAGIEVRELSSDEPAVALGSQAQLGQVALNLLLHAEQAARETPDRVITVAVSSRGKRVILEISFPAKPRDLEALSDSAPGSGALLSLAVCQGIVQNHGGTLRVLRSQPAQCRFEMELPAVRPGVLDTTPTSEVRAAQATQFTVLVAEPDLAAQRRLIRMLDMRGHRAVPVASSDEGVDLVQRMRFDISICSMHVESLNWVQFFQRVRHNVSAFVLLAEGHDPDLARIFDGGGGYLLQKPIEDAELDDLLHNIGADVSSGAMAGNG